MRTLVEVANERNVTRLESVGIAVALGSMPTQSLVQLAGNLFDRQQASKHDWKTEQLQRDLLYVSQEFGSRDLEAA